MSRARGGEPLIITAGDEDAATEPCTAGSTGKTLKDIYGSAITYIEEPLKAMCAPGPRNRAERRQLARARRRNP